MKSLFVIFLMLPIFCFAQAGKAFNGASEADCYKFILEGIIRSDSSVKEISGMLMNPNIKTLYVQQTAFVKNLPDTLGGLPVSYIDPYSATPEVYKDISGGRAALVYIGKPMEKMAYFTFFVMPMTLEKKGRKMRPGYAEKGCKVVFYLNYGTAAFQYDRTECF